MWKMYRIKEVFANKEKVADLEEHESNLQNFIAKYLVFAGVWKSKANHTHNSAIAMINLTVLIVGFLSISYMFILRYDDIDINTEILLHTVEMFHAICMQIIFIRRKDDIARLSEVFCFTTKQMNLPVCIQKECAAIFNKERKSFLKIMKLAFAAIIIVYASVVYDSNAFGFKGERKLLYPSWFPFETDVHHHTGLYYLAITFELLMYVEMLFIDLAAFGLWYWTICAVSGILDILGLTFQKISEGISSDESLETKIKMRIRIRNCVCLHNFSINLVKTLNSSIGVMLLVIVLSGEVAICFCGFHVIQALYTSDTSSRLLKFFIGVGTFSLMLFVYCASGQKLKNKSEDFFKSLYFSQWYQQSRSYKKSLHLCQTISNKPLLIDGAQILPADLHTFVYAMKGVFSVLNFLLAIKEKL